MASLLEIAGADLAPDSRVPLPEAEAAEIGEQLIGAVVVDGVGRNAFIKKEDLGDKSIAVAVSDQVGPDRSALADAL
jgi:hypothetical protein